MNKEAMQTALRYRDVFNQAIDHNYRLKLALRTRDMTPKQIHKWITSIPDSFDHMENDPDGAPFSEEDLFNMFAFADYLKFTATDEEDA